MNYCTFNQVTAMKPQDILREKSSLWIFGYGSLVWKPDFAFKGRKIGYINGYKRRFWHGDDFYRGDKEKVSLLRATETFIHVYDFVISQYVEDKNLLLSTARQSGHTGGGAGGECALVFKVLFRVLLVYTACCSE